MAEKDEGSSQSFSMFFDQHFDPCSYVNALFQSFTAEKKFPDIYSKESLQTYSKNCSNLVTHLEYYMQEIVLDLDNEISSLSDSTNIISDGKDGEKSGPITRLNYFINALNNSILLLQDEYAQSRKAISEAVQQQPRSIDLLIKFEEVKKNLMDVLQVLEKVNSMNESGDDLLGTDTFQNSISLLQELVIEQLHRNKERREIYANIDELINLLPVFQNLTHFYAIYKKFTNKLVSEKERCTNSQ